MVGGRAGRAGLLALAALTAFGAESGRPETKAEAAARFKAEAPARAAQAESQKRARREARASFLESLRLVQEDGECVAFDPGQGTCLVTVGDFNRRAEGWPETPASEPQPGTPEGIASLRRDVLTSMLAAWFPAHAMARDSGKDSLDEAWRARREERLQADRRKIGDSVLLAAYQSFRERHFRGRIDKVLQVIGGSDSLQMDSIRKAVIAPPAAGDSGRAAAGWRTPAPADLPAHVAALADSLARGEVSGLLRAPYGFLIVRWTMTRQTPEVSFEAALPVLLATLRVSPASAIRPSAPDPRVHVGSRFRVRLLPNSPRSSGRSGARLASLAGRDAGYRDLPPSLQEQTEIYLPAPDGEILGPFPSAFGTWSLEAIPPRVAATRSPGENGLPKRAGSEGAGDFAAALEEAQRRDRAGWNQLALHYLRSRGMIAAEREAWLHRYLNIRFIDLGGGS